jgi:hypothetical protein
MQVVKPARACLAVKAQVVEKTKDAKMKMKAMDSWRIQPTDCQESTRRIRRSRTRLDQIFSINTVSG